MNDTSSVGVPGWSFLRLPMDGKSVAETCDIDPATGGQNGQAVSKSIMEVVSFIAQIHRTYGVQGNGSVVEEIKKLVNHYASKVTNNSLKSIQDAEELLFVIEEFSCPICFSVINEPQTIRCGHSYCKKCLLKEAVGNSCKLCKYKITATDVKDSKTNVLLLSLFETLWANENKATSLRNEGNDLFCKKELNKALLKYTEALKLCANDHLTLCNRSHALLTLGEGENALVDAEEAIKSCPTWPKSYYRKGVSFTSLGRYEEAFLTLIPCIFLITATKTATEAALAPVKNEMCKVVQKLLQSSPVVGQPSLRRHTLDHKSFSPYSRQNKSSSKADQSWRSNTCSESDYYSSGDEADTVSSLKRRFFSFQEPSSKTVVDPFVARIRRLFSKGLKDLEVLQDQLKKMARPNRAFDKSLIAAADFECSLCYRLLYQPVTTACGHTYCKSCLERCLDHSPTCPLCKTALQDYFIYQRHSITHIIDNIITEYLPVEHAERVNQHLEELAGGGIQGVSTKLEVPIFVCTMAFPTVPCPLHVFEPRYRLMIRRCMESGTKQFGMCCYLQEGLHNYAEFGTLLEIRSAQYFPDGRSVVDTIGVKRFKVLNKSMKDGYHTATIEFLHDKPIEESERSELKDSHEKVFKEGNEWLSSISQVLRQRIYTHFGQMPEPDEDWMKVPNGPSWTWWLLAILPLETKAQLSILSMNSLQKRLESIQRVLQVVKLKLTAGSQ